jgi:uncharacterized membrane protein (DUF485 family)
MLPSSDSSNIHEHPLYQQLLQTRKKITTPLTILGLLSYFGLILAGAFIPKELVKPVVEGSITSWGIVLGFAVIVGCLIITAVYVHMANKYVEPILKQLKEQVVK